MGDRIMKKGFSSGLLWIAAVLGIAGCGSEQPVVEKKEGPKETVKQPEEKGAEKPAVSKKEDWIVERPNREIEWKTLAAEVGVSLSAGKLDEAQQGIEKLDRL